MKKYRIVVNGNEATEQALKKLKVSGCFQDPDDYYVKDINESRGGEELN